MDSDKIKEILGEKADYLQEMKNLLAIKTAGGDYLMNATHFIFGLKPYLPAEITADIAELLKNEQVLNC